MTLDENAPGLGPSPQGSFCNPPPRPPSPSGDPDALQQRREAWNDARREMAIWSFLAISRLAGDAFQASFEIPLWRADAGGEFAERDWAKTMAVVDQMRDALSLIALSAETFHPDAVANSPLERGV